MFHGHYSYNTYTYIWRLPTSVCFPFWGVNHILLHLRLLYWYTFSLPLLFLGIVINTFSSFLRSEVLSLLFLVHRCFYLPRPLPSRNRYPDDPINQSNDNFGNQLPFSMENDDHPPSSPFSKPEVPDVPDRDTEHPSHTQENPPVPLPQWHDEDTPRCGMRQWTVQSHPDSVYGDRTPVDLQWDNLSRRAGNQPDSSHAPPKQPTQNSISRSSCALPPPHQTTTDTDDDTGEDPVDTLGQVHLNRLVWEGGVEFIAFLLNKAVPIASDQLVFYKDIARLPSQLWEQWKRACQEELEALHKRKVFELANLPKGHKAIKNRWIFTTKTNGHK